jgi:hypothetical protein
MRVSEVLLIHGDVDDYILTRKRFSPGEGRQAAFAQKVHDLRNELNELRSS